MAESGERWTLTGGCPMCSFGDHVVIHGVPWCPDIPAVMEADTNSGRWLDDGRLVRCGRVTRPVDADEVLLILDNGDGPGQPFATWGRALGRIGERQVGEAIEAGRTTGNGWLYVEHATGASGSPREGGRSDG